MVPFTSIWRGVASLLLLVMMTSLAIPAGAEPEGLKAGAATGSLQVSIFDCPAGDDPATDVSDCSPASQPWNMWLAPLGSEQAGEERWLLDDAVEVEPGVYRFDDLTPGAWEISPDQDGPDGPVEVVVTGDATAGSGLWQVEVVAESQAAVSVYRTVPEGHAETGSVVVQLMTCEAGTAPLVDDGTCKVASEPWDVTLELAGQDDSQTWTLADDAEVQADQTWLLTDLPVATLSIVSRSPVDETDLIAGGDAYLLSDRPVVTVVGGETVTVILYQVPIV